MNLQRDYILSLEAPFPIPDDIRDMVRIVLECSPFGLDPQTPSWTERQDFSGQSAAIRWNWARNGIPGSLSYEVTLSWSRLDWVIDMQFAGGESRYMQGKRSSLLSMPAYQAARDYILRSIAERQNMLGYAS